MLCLILVRILPTTDPTKLIKSPDGIPTGVVVLSERISFVCDSKDTLEDVNAY